MHEDNFTCIACIVHKKNCTSCRDYSLRRNHNTDCFSQSYNSRWFETMSNLQCHQSQHACKCRDPQVQPGRTIAPTQRRSEFALAHLHEVGGQAERRGHDDGQDVGDAEREDDHVGRDAVPRALVPRHHLQHTTTIFSHTCGGNGGRRRGIFSSNQGWPHDRSEPGH